jgi:N utilization substance protein B
MANRHLQRSIVLQTLFEWDFNQDKEDFDILEALDRNIEEFAPGTNDSSFMKDLVSLVHKKKSVVDEVIEKAAPDWPLDKIANVDRNILRLGLTELLFGDRDQVPPKVAINESIELAKTFGGDKSFKFVNGVLGAVYKEIGEPGKDQASAPRKKKKSEEPIDPSKLPVEKKAGALVYAMDGDEIKFAFVHDVFGYWTIAKGGVEENEEAKDGAVRKVKEKIGLDIEIIDLLGENEYIASHPEKGKLRKQVSYFLGKSDLKELKLNPDAGGLDNAKWFTLEELQDDFKTYDDILPLIARAVTIISNTN